MDRQALVARDYSAFWYSPFHDVHHNAWYPVPVNVHPWPSQLWYHCPLSDPFVGQKTAPASMFEIWAFREGDFAFGVVSDSIRYTQTH